MREEKKEKSVADESSLMKYKALNKLLKIIVIALGVAIVVLLVVSVIENFF